MREFEEYLCQADFYLSDADEDLKKGDLRQAGEKYWGAVAQVVKAYAVIEGLNHDGHKELFKVVSQMYKKTNDKELLDLFGNANALHINFYEGWMTDDEIEIHVELSKRFIDKVKTIISNLKNKTNN